MTIEFDIDQQMKVIVIRTYDVIGIGDIDAIIKKIKHHPNFTENMSTLIDAREIKRAFFIREMDALLKILAAQATDFVDCYAFVVSNEIAMVLGKRFHFRALRAGLKLSMFLDHAAALNWINKSNE